MITTDGGTGPGRSGRRRLLLAACAVAVLAAVVLVLVTVHPGHHGSAADARSSATASTVPGPVASTPGAASTPRSSTSAGAGSAPVGMARAVPVSVWIPKINARSSLVPLGLNSDGSLQTPPVSTPMQAGWYDRGPTPGQVGPAVIVGHVDGDSQEGIFFRLRELGPGDTIMVARQDGSSARFVVQRRTEVSKDHFPTVAVYGPTAGPELRLITCGGSFDSSVRSYRDNIIVYAKLANL